MSKEMRIKSMVLKEHDGSWFGHVETKIVKSKSHGNMLEIEYCLKENCPYLKELYITDPNNIGTEREYLGEEGES